MRQKKDKEFEQLSFMDQLNTVNQESNEDYVDPVDEHIQEITSMDLPLDWDNFYDTDESAQGVFAESAADGLVKSLNTLGRVDIEYISTITGLDYRTVIERLRGSIYQNPDTWGECFFMGWETADEYISGNIRRKLESALQSNEDYNGYFSDNVEALRKALPTGIHYGDIYVTLGSPWVPVDIISDFVAHLYYDGKRNIYGRRSHFDVRHDDVTGTWEFNWKYKKNYFYYEVDEQFGTFSWGAMEILLRTLNMQSVAVYDTKKSDLTKSGKVSVLNKEETVAAIEKQKLLVQEFQKWVWSDEKRKKRLTDLYEEKFLNVRTRHFGGSFLEFPGMNPEVSLLNYQKDAVARILFTPNTLLAHDVGSGKTYVMTAAGMELRRMGMSTKNMYVLPNNIVGQWKNIFMEIYPNANILCVEHKDFTPAKRQDMLAKMRDNDYDGILLSYSCFSQIPLSKECHIELIDMEMTQIAEQINETRPMTKRLQNRYNLLREKREKVEETEGICFDQLGITRLFVDEAHNFKNVPIESKIENVLGISKSGSKKCEDMMNKVKVVQKRNGGGGVVFATGTPITNSITDAFIMQSYLQSGELAVMGLQNFDSWVGMFAECATNFEVDVDTSRFRLATRFSRFHNLPELTTMLASIADFHRVDASAGIPEHYGYEDIQIAKTTEFGYYLEEISERAETVRQGLVRRSDDNMLKITTDGRKAALDLRLADARASFSTDSKVYRCAERVAEIYRRTAEQSSTQLIFCDTSAPKEGFNVYDELKRILMELDVDEHEIAYIHDAKTEAKREKLFQTVRNGEIRILIGSTFKLGLGVNIQNKLIALHHLDVPWRPADMVQREGRILRQGNENKTVEIYRYITEGSFDAYSWQLLETKQRFIADLLSGSVQERQGSDIDDTVLDYAEVKAIAIGNPLIKERVEVSNELSRYQILHRQKVDLKERYSRELTDIPKEIEHLEEILPKCKTDAEYYAEHKQEYSAEERKEIRVVIHEATHREEPTKEETVLMQYQGFDVVVPARVSASHPLIFLKRTGKYSVELTITDIGCMLRIDRCLEELGKRYKDISERLERLKNKKDYMEKEMQSEDIYVEEIDRCKQKIQEIDQKLGVKNNE